MIYHPRLDTDGAKVPVLDPSSSTPAETWLAPGAAAKYSLTDDGGQLPESLFGVAFAAPSEAPLTMKGWKKIDPEFQLEEPPYPTQYGLRLTSGCVIAEPDDRVWIVYPTNSFGGVAATFPKGRAEPGISLLTNAVKETVEESGLWVKPLSYLCDIVRTRSVTRYYMARRIGGTPAAAGWESQAVGLVPVASLYRILNLHNDRKVIPCLINWLLEHGAAV